MSIHRVTGCSNKERKLLIYDDRKCFDGTEFFTSTKKELNEWSVLKSYTSKYIPVQKSKDESFEDAYERFVKQADALKHVSKGKINLYKTGTLKKACLSYFFKFANKKNQVCEEMTADEVRWVCKCDHGQIYYKDKTFEDKAYSYDINSMYAFCMSSVNFKVPMKQGTFKTLSADEFDNAKFYEYGIYRVRIESDDNVNTVKMFRFNKNNYYTSIDLNVAKKLGMKMNIIVDGHDNFLHYGSGKSETGSRVFKDFVTTLYDWRVQSGNKDFKLLMVLLWGLLSEKNLKSIQYDNNLNFDFDIDTDKYDILDTINIRGDIWKINFVEKNKYFKYAWSRIKPFLLAYARQHIGRVMEPYLDQIVHVNTDGFRTRNEIDIELGTGLGQIKFEGLK